MVRRWAGSRRAADLVLGGSLLTRQWVGLERRTAQDLDRDTMNARIWLGIHFRTAMTDGNQLGHRVSHWALGHYFQPVG